MKENLKDYKIIDLHNKSDKEINIIILNELSQELIEIGEIGHEK